LSLRAAGDDQQLWHDRTTFLFGTLNVLGADDEDRAVGQPTES
jgi:hypothetical protein